MKHIDIPAATGLGEIVVVEGEMDVLKATAEVINEISRETNLA